MTIKISLPMYLTPLIPETLAFLAITSAATALIFIALHPTFKKDKFTPHGFKRIPVPDGYWPYIGKKH